MSDRLFLLISAIANNPGIAPSGVGIDPMQALLHEMEAIARARGIPWQDWSANTIRKDLRTLRRYGILREGTHLRSGYYLGKEPPELPVVQRDRPRSQKRKINAEEMARLQDEGETLEEIGAIAGIGREAVRQAIKKWRDASET